MKKSMYTCDLLIENTGAISVTTITRNHIYVQTMSQNLDGVRIIARGSVFKLATHKKA